MQEVKIRNGTRLFTIQTGDVVLFKYSSRAKDKSFVDTGVVRGRVEQLYEHYFTVLSPKGYRRTVRYVDIICGHAKLVDQRRGKEKVPDEYSLEVPRE